MNSNEIEYSHFALYYREIAEHLKKLEVKEEELLEREEAIPLSLKKELFRHTIISNILAQIGEEKYRKNREELYQDGLNFMTAEKKKKGKITW